jgi:hypothetical protein
MEDGSGAGEAGEARKRRCVEAILMKARLQRGEADRKVDMAQLTEELLPQLETELGTEPSHATPSEAPLTQQAADEQQRLSREALRGLLEDALEEREKTFSRWRSEGRCSHG